MAEVLFIEYLEGKILKYQHLSHSAETPDIALVFLFDLWTFCQFMYLFSVACACVCVELAASRKSSCLISLRLCEMLSRTGRPCLKEPFVSYCEEHLKNLKKLFSTVNKLLWNWKFPWMLKDLPGTVNGNNPFIFFKRGGSSKCVSVGKIVQCALNHFATLTL